MSDFPSLPRLHPIAGIRLASAAAGIRYQNRPDVALVELAPETQTAAVFTQNAFCAAPVILARQHLNAGAPRYLIINSGNANAGTGQAGIEAAHATCTRLAQLAEMNPEAVLPFSTGVIGEPLAAERICDALPNLLGALDAKGWENALRAMMTTDRFPKGASRQVTLNNGRIVTVTGIAKGAGMIRPDMATMLAFIGTDARLSKAQLQAMLGAAVHRSFNRITVDGDTSTNDACVLMATQRVAVEAVDMKSVGEAVAEVCEELAKHMVRDGEGATKLVTVQVQQGADSEECLKVAYTIAHSPLVKTALFAEDANWGRILAAVGRAELSELDIGRVEIDLDGVAIVRGGQRAPDYIEARVAAVMKQAEFTMTVRLGRGDARERIWTCDLGHTYVKINAEYRT